MLRCTKNAPIDNITVDTITKDVNALTFLNTSSLIALNNINDVMINISNALNTTPNANAAFTNAPLPIYMNNAPIVMIIVDVRTTVFKSLTLLNTSDLTAANIINGDTINNSNTDKTRPNLSAFFTNSPLLIYMNNAPIPKIIVDVINSLCNPSTPFVACFS